MRVQQTNQFLDLKAQFRPLETTTEATIDVDTVANVPVETATIERYELVKNDFLGPQALTTVDMEFGIISQEQFHDLKAEFGGRSEVKYDPTREYGAEAFLPPALQALLGQDLEVPERQLLPDTSGWELRPYEEDKRVDLTANCHGTTWEAVQALQGQDDLDIFFGDALIMDDTLEEPKYFTKLGELTPEQVDANKLQEMELKPGDVVAFHNPQGYQVTNLLHTATYVGGGLFFEKPDTESREEDAPYRLATPETMTGPLRSYLDATPKMKIYRPATKLPKPEEVFEAGLNEETAAWEKEHGQSIGQPLLTQLEFSMGGGISGQYLTALADQAVELDETGYGYLAG